MAVFRPWVPDAANTIMCGPRAIPKPNGADRFVRHPALIPVLARLGEGNHPADNPERNYDQKA
jgi:hypothetical protein